jgi:hypothetical protein
MVLLNTALRLPALDLEALMQGESIVAISQRFIVPGKHFALMPSDALPNALPQEIVYKPSAIEKFAGSVQPDSETITLKTWAKCEFCQHFTDLSKLESLSQLTLWTPDLLSKLVYDGGYLFLTFLRVYSLTEPLAIANASHDRDTDQMGKIVALPHYLDVGEVNPALNEQQFETLKQKIITLKTELSTETASVEIATEHTTVDTPSELTSIENLVTPPEATEPEVEPQESSKNILDGSDWFMKIAEIGNSSDGHMFEKLVRKSFLALGFSNSLNNSKASLDPYATGGAGGIDFYCDAPYAVVGECKATATTKIPSKTPGQLVQLGMNHLQEQYNLCIKMIVAAGALTPDAVLTTIHNKINVVRPETLQRLVNLKMKYPQALNLLDLKPILQEEPFGEEADAKLGEFIQSVWQELETRSRLVESVRGASEDNEGQSVEIAEIRGYHNAIHQSEPVYKLDSKHVVRELLIELSSPFTNYIRRSKDGSGKEVFEFVQPLKIEE